MNGYVAPVLGRQLAERRLDAVWQRRRGVTVQPGPSCTGRSIVRTV